MPVIHAPTPPTGGQGPPRQRPSAVTYSPPSFVPGASITAGSVVFAGGFATPASVVPNCPNCGASLLFMQVPFTPPWLCENDSLSFTFAEVSAKAQGMWRSWYQDFGGGSDIDRRNLRMAVANEMQVT